MSIIVSDTSPICLLVDVGFESILPSLFGRVLVPPEVVRELNHPRAPIRVQAFSRSLPPWLEVVPPLAPQTFKALDAGESAALSLAVERNASVLIDEAEGRRVARELGLVVIGAIGVLELAATRGLIGDLEAVYRDVRTRRFHVSSALLDQSLARWRRALTPPLPDV